jgi:hypothetical protein
MGALARAGREFGLAAVVAASEARKERRQRATPLSAEQLATIRQTGKPGIGALA